VLGIVTGEGAERGAASIVALGSDPRFDLRRAYWVVAGIAGVDPNAASVGSAAWANWVVNARKPATATGIVVPRSTIKILANAEKPRWYGILVESKQQKPAPTR
jgi:purine nucleoside permease